MKRNILTLPSSRQLISWSDFAVGDHRISCPSCGRKPSDKTMGIRINEDGRGVAHCFRCGYVETRHRERDPSMLKQHPVARVVNVMTGLHFAEQREREAEAAAGALVRWAAADWAAREHRYLTVKGVGAHGIRVDGDLLLVPIRDNNRCLLSLQSISPFGVKRFHPRGRVKGGYHAIGCPNGKVVICEGYATGATIHEDTHCAVAVAFNSGNLVPVALALRAKYPELTLVIAADDDWKTPGNPGLTAARQAAAAVGGLLAVPDFTGLPRGDHDSDFNDLHRLAGRIEVAE